MAKITFEDKETLSEQSTIPRKYKVTAEDMNEIKQIINELLLNTYSESPDNAYSCEYINNINKYSTDETFTGEYTSDGKKIYRKEVSGTLSSEWTYLVKNVERIINHRIYVNQAEGLARPMEYISSVDLALNNNSIIIRDTNTSSTAYNKSFYGYIKYTKVED